MISKIERKFYHFVYQVQSAIGLDAVVLNAILFDFHLQIMTH